MTATTTAGGGAHGTAERVEVLYFEACPSTDAFLPRLRDVLVGVGMGDRLVLRRVETVDAAEHERFLGSPTVRVNGRDIEPGAEARTDFGLKCRLYRTETGMRGAPPEEWVLAALGIPAPPSGLAISGLWASERIAGLSSQQRAVHREVLRGFAAGIEPTAERLADWAAVERAEIGETVQALAERDLVHATQARERSWWPIRSRGCRRRTGCN
jgi:hypothetical protein